MHQKGPRLGGALEQTWTPDAKVRYTMDVELELAPEESRRHSSDMAFGLTVAALAFGDAKAALGMDDPESVSCVPGGDNMRRHCLDCDYDAAGESCLQEYLAAVKGRRDDPEPVKRDCQGAGGHCGGSGQDGGAANRFFQVCAVCEATPAARGCPCCRAAVCQDCWSDESSCCAICVFERHGWVENGRAPPLLAPQQQQRRQQHQEMRGRLGPEG